MLMNFEKIMKTTFYTIFLLFFILCACTHKEKSAELVEGTSDYKLAKELAEKLPYLDPDANNIWISCKDFDVRTSDILQAMRDIYGNNIVRIQNRSGERLKEAFYETGKDFCVKKLMLNKALAAGIDVKQAEVDSMLTRLVTIKGEEKYAEYLKTSGQTFDDVKADMRNRLLAERYLASVMPDKIKVSETELLQAYQKDKVVTLRQILMTTSDKPDSLKQQTFEKMEEIRQMAINGDDFIELVLAYSDDVSSKKNGGLYRIVRGDATEVLALQEVAFTLPIGEISEVIKTEQGLHIIKIIDRQSETRPLSMVRKELEAYLANEKRQLAYEEVIENLQTEADYKVIEF